MDLDVFPRNISKETLKLFRKNVFEKSIYSKYVGIGIVTKNGKPIMFSIGDDYFPDMDPSLENEFQIYNMFDDLLIPSVKVFGDLIAMFSGDYGDGPSLGEYMWKLSDPDKYGWKRPAPNYYQMIEIIREVFQNFQKM